VAKVVKEIWKPIPSYEGLYEISNTGKIKSLPKSGSGNSLSEKIMNDFDNGKGYRYITLTNKTKRRNFYVHRLLAESFISNPGKKPFVNHLDGNKANNKLSNLEWSTESENMEHASVLGLLPSGEKNHLSKLKEIDIKQIRLLWQSGTHRDIIKAKYSISYAQIHRIVNNQCWKYV